MSWLRSYLIPSPTSEHGRKRMGTVRSIVMALVPRVFDPTAKPCGQFASVWHQMRFLWATRELRWPMIRRHEESALLGIAATLDLDADGLPTPIYTIRQA